MDRKKIFWAIITILISAAILVVITDMIFKLNNINEGKFRVADSIITSTVELTYKNDADEEKKTWTFDVSQNNILSLIIANRTNMKIKDIYIENIKVISGGDIYIEQIEYESSHKIEGKNEKINIYSETREDGSEIIEFNINNKNIIKNYNVPSDVKEIRHDGTILNIAGVKLSDIEFKFKASLIVVEENGSKNICKISLKMPKEELITNGQIVERLSLENFSFKVSD